MIKQPAIAKLAVALALATLAGCDRPPADDTDRATDPAPLDTEPGIVVELIPFERAPTETWLAVRMTIGPGWHVYWTNPGDAGLATRATLTAPAGLTVGPVQFPGPRRFEAPGSIITFGYERETVLLARVDAAADIDLPAAAEFVAEVRWLACKETCVPGNRRVTARVGDTLRGDEAKSMVTHLERLPRPLAELVGADAAFTAATTLHLTLPTATDAEFFPDASARARVATQHFSAIDTVLGIEFRRISADVAEPVTLDGIARTTQPGQGDVYYAVSLPWPGATSDGS